MIRASRRGVLSGALAVPTVAGLAHWRWRHGEASVLVHDPALAAGRRFAEAGAARGGQVVAIEGDRIRLARTVLERKPALIAGVSRHADALMIEEVAREAGYVPVAALHGRGRTCSDECQPGWNALGRLARAAEDNWIEALADYAVRPGELAGTAVASTLPPRGDLGLVLGWVLVPRV
ncbi:MAG: hypothetical protein J7493_05545 [Porphyrobacter sp.]|nr:hypothetical protein [Porphyrobacter sp.]